MENCFEEQIMDSHSGGFERAPTALSQGIQGMVGRDGDEDEQVFEEELQKHLINRSRGSSINLSFDLSSDSSSDASMSPSERRFRDDLMDNPVHLRMYIKEKLRYHFMSPLEKWHYRKVFPWKMVFQIIKIFIVTIQILLFGMDSTQFYKEKAASQTTLKVYFLKDWDPIRDVYFYPPTDGPYAVFTEKEIFDSIDTIVRRYAVITDEMIGSFSYNSKNNTIVPPQLCFDYYKKVEVFPFNSSVIFDNRVISKCIELDPDDYSTFSIIDYLDHANITIDLQRVVRAKIGFSLNAMYRRRRLVFDSFKSYRLRTEITFQNHMHDGMVGLGMEVESIPSPAPWPQPHRSWETICRQTLNVFVIGLCCFSLITCVRSIFRCFHLLGKTVEYFDTQSIKLSLSDRLEFIDFWLGLIVLNDCLVIAGTSLKITLDYQIVSRDRYLETSVLLGVGLLLVWSGVIRYVGYLKTYNILILTLKNSTPNLLKFLTCGITIFTGYTLCGWVVLGPHHQKFKTISTSMECLYAITNGDDIFATFALATNEYGERGISASIWWFSRIYLYSFVILFICVVINLLYAVIIDSYDTLKDISDQSEGNTKSLLVKFIEEEPYGSTSRLFLMDEANERMGTFEYLACLFPWLAPRRTDEYIDDAYQEPTSSHSGEDSGR